MLYEDALDLEGADAVAGREDHVVRAAHEPQIPVLVLVRPVAGEVVAVPEDGPGLLRLIPVLLEEARNPAGERDVARLVRPALVALRVYYAYVAAGGGLAHRAGPDLEAWKIPGEQGVLRLAVAVVDSDVVQLLPP